MFGLLVAILIEYAKDWEKSRCYKLSVYLGYRWKLRTFL